MAWCWRRSKKVLALSADVFPDEEVPARARLVLEDAFGDDQS
jgi:hypothetical protein